MNGASAVDASLPAGVSGAIGELSQLVGSGILESVASIVSSLALTLVFFIITALLAYFMLRDGDRGMDVDHVASRWLAPDADHGRGRSGGDDARRLHDRDGALALFNAVTGFIVMTLLGLPWPSRSRSSRSSVGSSRTSASSSRA